MRLALTNDDAYDLVVDVASGRVDDVPTIAKPFEAHNSPRAGSQMCDPSLIGRVGRWLDVRALRARCVPAGTSGPPVVLLHGGSSLGGGAATPSCASSPIGGMQPRERPETSTG